MKHYLHRNYWYGVQGDLHDALADLDAPTPNGGERLTASDFETVSAEEYDEAILDLRYENREWQQ